MKSGLLKKLLLFMLLTLIVNALLTTGVFTFTSRNVFANMKAREMVPRAESISTLWSQLLLGEISEQDFTWFTAAVLDRSMWDSSVFVYLAESEEWLTHKDLRSDPQIFNVLQGFLPELLNNQRTLLQTTTDQAGIVIGKPIYGVDAEILGVVFLTKPLNEVNAALSGLNAALIISLLIIFAVMLPTSYFGSRSLTNPLMKMSEAAKAMAKGDFSVRADAHGRDEVGQLGQSLNELSDALSHTIGALMLERNRLQNVLDGLFEGIVAVDSDGAATHCNPAALRLLGVDTPSAYLAVERLRTLWPNLFLGDEDEEALPGVPAQEENAAEKMARQRAVGPACRTVEANGMQLQITVSAVIAYDGKIAGAVAVIQDVTEQMRLEQTRRDYVANVSHELRTPIASIRSLADTLNDGMVKKEEDRQRYYGYILRESMRLSRLIDDLLELSRLQSGGVALTRRSFSLNALLLELAERFEVIAGDSGLSFALDLPPGEYHAYSNEDRVEQVLIALLDNAVKYAADEGRITLRLQQQEDGLLLSVCNTGEIDGMHLPYLFDRFYKADASHSGEGTGLGLAIAREVMTLLGERIWAENCDGEACFRMTVRGKTNNEE